MIICLLNAAVCLSQCSNVIGTYTIIYGEYQDNSMRHCVVYKVDFMSDRINDKPDTTRITKHTP